MRADALPVSLTAWSLAANSHTANPERLHVSPPSPPEAALHRGKYTALEVVLTCCVILGNLTSQRPFSHFENVDNNIYL